VQAKQSAFGSKASVWHRDSATPPPPLVIPSCLAASCCVRFVLHSYSHAHSLTNTVLGCSCLKVQSFMSGEAQQLEHECKLSFSYSARLSGQMMSLSKDALHTHCVPYTKTIHSHSLALSHTPPPSRTHNPPAQREGKERRNVRLRVQRRLSATLPPLVRPLCRRCRHAQSLVRMTTKDLCVYILTPTKKKDNHNSLVT
jgi:hypothetical protein